MEVSELPAVKDAVSSGGIFTKAVRKEQGESLAGAGRVLLQVPVAFFFGCVFAGAGLIIGLSSGNAEPFGLILIGFLIGALLSGFITNKALHPNVELAKQILKTGTIPLNKIGPALKADAPSDRERLKVDKATLRLLSTDRLPFDEWFVIRTSHPFALTYGSYLFLSRGAIENSDLDKLIAHELGHLNNGDSFVKCALWVLGKGWTREHMSVTGKMADTDTKTQMAGLGSLAVAIARRSWELAIVEAGVMAIFATGSSVRGMEEDLRVYFEHWDIEADRFAETLVSPDSYQKYLKDLADFEKGVGTMPFSASAELRYDWALMRSWEE